MSPTQDGSHNWCQVLCRTSKASVNFWAASGQRAARVKLDSLDDFSFGLCWIHWWFKEKNINWMKFGSTSKTVFRRLISKRSCDLSFHKQPETKSASCRLCSMTVHVQLVTYMKTVTFFWSCKVSPAVCLEHHLSAAALEQNAVNWWIISLIQIISLSSVQRLILTHCVVCFVL